jgi:YidC/Oxa1 family membrane protein insertase
MPGLILLVTGWQPGAVCVWFAAGGALGIMQSLALRRHAMRELLMIAPFYKPRKRSIACRWP